MILAELLNFNRILKILSQETQQSSLEAKDDLHEKIKQSALVEKFRINLRCLLKVLITISDSRIGKGIKLSKSDRRTL